MMLLMFSILFVAVFLLYVVMETKGIPSSLSETFYTLGDDGWLFQMVMITVSIALAMPWLSVSSEYFQFLAFLSCGGLMFVGSAPCFRLPIHGFVHYTSAVVCCVCAVLWQILESLWDVTLLWTWVGGMLCLAMRDKWCWWVEIAVIGSLFSNLLRLYL